jgi:hypothetical protein
MVDVITDTVIRAPSAMVASFVMDPDNAPRWYVNISAVEWRSPKPLQLGSRIAFVAHFLRRRLCYTYEVIDLVPGRRLLMRTSQGPFPMETTYEVEPVTDTTCRMHLRNRGTPRGFGTLVAPFVAFAMRRANRQDLRRLRTLLESAA